MMWKQYLTLMASPTPKSCGTFDMASSCSWDFVFFSVKATAVHILHKCPLEAFSPRFWNLMAQKSCLNVELFRINTLFKWNIHQRGNLSLIQREAPCYYSVLFGIIRILATYTLNCELVTQSGDEISPLRGLFTSRVTDICDICTGVICYFLHH